MQPLLTHVPPNKWRSIIATFSPASTKRAASEGPACPAPITIESNFFIKILLIIGGKCFTTANYITFSAKDDS